MIETFDAPDALVMLAPAATSVIYLADEDVAFDVRALAIGLDTALVVPLAPVFDADAQSFSQELASLADHLRCASDINTLNKVALTTIAFVRMKLGVAKQHGLERAQADGGATTDTDHSEPGGATHDLHHLLQEMAKAEQGQVTSLAR